MYGCYNSHILYGFCEGNSYYLLDSEWLYQQEKDVIVIGGIGVVRNYMGEACYGVNCSINNETGKIEVLEEHKSELSAIEVPLSQIKRISERSVTATLQKLMKQSDEDFGDVKSEKDFFGFRFKDLVALYNDKIKGINPDKKSSFKDMIVDITNKPFSDLTYKQKQMLDYIKVSAYDIIVANSGGHPCITNIAGINYLGRDGLPMLKKLAAAMLSKLKQKVN